MRLLESSYSTYSGLAYRVTHRDYSDADKLLTGLGSKKYGGRWNPRSPVPIPAIAKPSSSFVHLLKTGFPVVYSSLDLESCAAEAVYSALLFYLAPKCIPLDYWDSRRLGTFKVNAAKLLDLCLPSIRKGLGVNKAQLMSEWLPVQMDGKEALTQAIGRAARSLGFEGLVVPSARRSRRGKNLVLFPETMAELPSIISVERPPKIFDRKLLSS